MLLAIARMTTAQSVTAALVAVLAGLRHINTMPIAEHSVARPPAKCPARTAAQ